MTAPTADHASGATALTDALNAFADHRPEPQAVQLLRPDGTLTLPPEHIPGYGSELLRALYRDMRMARELDTEATALQRQGELGLWPPLLGQEAAQIGSAHALRPDDHVFPSYREHGVAWCRGVDPVDVVRLFRGVTNGGWDPRGSGFHLYTLVVGAHVLHATGYAMSLAKRGSDAVAVAYFGDGASSEGDVAEAFTFAAVHDAPVLFLCQNNQWAISEPVTRQTSSPLYRRAQGFGFPGVRVDGNDALAVHAVTRHALDHIRGGGGPFFVEAFTYRMGAHTTSDDPTRYRPPAELEQWRARDPLARLRAHLSATGLAEPAFFEETEERATELAHRVRHAVRTMPDPAPAGVFDHVHAEGHALVDEERRRFEEYERSFTDPERP
ncbi:MULTISPECIES: pyruvate dehydrogenase (acetyl-transferring) E1 component subunit alpha [Streptomyces]|uniref:Pyruvate dehydrogenase (Acetyl-transferring) E1 component subunit alpha n=1 Tax=Streptomyces doudnae TaxID=3075536 RepID=A0ABD5EH16_9ACTN|nr:MULTISPECIES: pyruvate dehydrogenase (acetyl-transferring) E1 component subunit alpha [unclassified Streptomyces]MDT0433647.1 pyruvate dehydrogenase (acetyl-transferring) E1 component subunit alpha [Streptomyces sp. DSM 41981]MYQ68383.1 pyruvate dehydrogenase (acetyl-transferring) E1 component subunit alpha [Streptomyces sp. SID4950]SCE45683.1 pyruvate dehydrogenase E1 component alpha subunit [Streptomyces sp. SolWspMP-5a-2]